MNVDLTLNRSELRGLDQLSMGDGDRVQGPGELPLPEIEKVDEHGKAGRQIVFLPDIGLQKGWMIRHAVEDLGRRQPIAFHLADEVPGYHANSFSQGRTRAFQQVPTWQHRRFLPYAQG